jgi:hypothetical protein
MNVELSERKNDTDKQERVKRIKGSRYNREYESCMTEDSGVPGERKCKRKENDSEIKMWERGGRKQELDGRRRKKVQNVL